MLAHPRNLILTSRKDGPSEGTVGRKGSNVTKPYRHACKAHRELGFFCQRFHLPGTRSSVADIGMIIA